MRLFGFLPQKFLGVDIGTSSIKLVEVSGWANKRTLENYGEISAEAIYKKPFRTFDKSTLLLSTDEISKAIKAVVEETGVKAKEIAFSIPDFSSFFTTFDLPPMTEEEVPQAVRAEAKRYVPLPLGEVVLDWQITNRKQKSENEILNILLVAVPNEVINQYQKIAQDSNLKLTALEAEVFGLMRSCVKKDEKKIVALVDIGARSTSCSIIEKGTLKISRSFDLSGYNLTERISQGLSVEYRGADELKRKYGITAKDREKNGNVTEILTPLFDVIVKELRKIFMSFQIKKRKDVEKIILAGGTALLPGLLEYFKENFQENEVEIANPFINVFYPPILEDKLKEMGPSYAIALGMALRGFE